MVEDEPEVIHDSGFDEYNHKFLGTAFKKLKETLGKNISISDGRTLVRGLFAMLPVDERIFVEKILDKIRDNPDFEEFRHNLLFDEDGTRRKFESQVEFMRPVIDAYNKGDLPLYTRSLENLGMKREYAVELGRTFPPKMKTPDEWLDFFKEDKPRTYRRRLLSQKFIGEKDPQLGFKNAFPERLFNILWEGQPGIGKSFPAIHTSASFISEIKEGIIDEPQIIGVSRDIPQKVIAGASSEYVEMLLVLLNYKDAGVYGFQNWVMQGHLKYRAESSNLLKRTLGNIVGGKTKKKIGLIDVGEKNVQNIDPYLKINRLPGDNTCYNYGLVWMNLTRSVNLFSAGLPEAILDKELGPVNTAFNNVLGWDNITETYKKTINEIRSYTDKKMRIKSVEKLNNFYYNETIKRMKKGGMYLPWLHSAFELVQINTFSEVEGIPIMPLGLVFSGFDQISNINDRFDVELSVEDWKNILKVMTRMFNVYRPVDQYELGVYFVNPLAKEGELKPSNFYRNVANGVLKLAGRISIDQIEKAKLRTKITGYMTKPEVLHVEAAPTQEPEVSPFVPKETGHGEWPYMVTTLHSGNEDKWVLTQAKSLVQKALGEYITFPKGHGGESQLSRLIENMNEEILEHEWNLPIKYIVYRIKQIGAKEKNNMKTIIEKYSKEKGKIEINWDQPLNRIFNEINSKTNNLLSNNEKQWKLIYISFSLDQVDPKLAESTKRTAIDNILLSFMHLSKDWSKKEEQDIYAPSQLFTNILKNNLQMDLQMVVDKGSKPFKLVPLKHDLYTIYNQAAVLRVMYNKIIPAVESRAEIEEVLNSAERYRSFLNGFGTTPEKLHIENELKELIDLSKKPELEQDKKEKLKEIKMGIALKTETAVRCDFTYHLIQLASDLMEDYDHSIGVGEVAKIRTKFENSNIADAYNLIAEHTTLIEPRIIQKIDEWITDPPKYLKANKLVLAESETPGIYILRNEIGTDSMGVPKEKLKPRPVGGKVGTLRVVEATGGISEAKYNLEQELGEAIEETGCGIGDSYDFTETVSSIYIDAVLKKGGSLVDKKEGKYTFKQDPTTGKNIANILALEIVADVYERVFKEKRKYEGQDVNTQKDIQKKINEDLKSYQPLPLMDERKLLHELLDISVSEEAYSVLKEKYEINAYTVEGGPILSLELRSFSSPSEMQSV